ncbi:MAG TPA: nitroreductase family deazaflavin-dependent oxidoreductase [Ktedonobacteraceae bacterium]|nr:nitroreductase family deazaflavin-dependent oxidoreductase [Ktedonobacteraceae bacterium]
MKDWNRQVIDEFHTNGGKVGGPFEGAPLLLLTTTGAKSGKKFTTPLMYLPDGDRMFIFASKGGSPTNPDWYHNLVTHPNATVEVGTDKFDVTATVVTGEERDRIYAEQSKRYPNFAEYQEKTSRRIPVVELKRKKG